MTRSLLGEILVSDGLLSAKDLERALSAQAELGGFLGRVLVSLGVVSEIDVVRALSRQLDIPVLGAEEFPVDLPQLSNLSLEFLQSNSVVPIRVDGERLLVAMLMPQDLYVTKALRLATGLDVVPTFALEADIGASLKRLQIDADPSALDEAPEINEAGDFVEHLRDLASEAPVIRLVNSLIGKVTDMRASDIHLEPFEDSLHVRYRVDGVIQAADPIPGRLSAAVTSRLKLLAHLNIAERRLPQDGRIKMRVKGRELDLRVSSVPTVHGESVVMRVLDRSSVRFGLDEMGFSPDTLIKFNDLLARPHGILLVTGPTGSGKTTTLYAALSTLDSDALKILTVEDPVEYQLEGINQIQVLPQIGLTFGHALRSILRQDPDIIMIGEMRDGETAQIAVQSALTGHLVLSTLHTNTAAGAIVRLQDMGVERYLITSSVNGVLAQRLVRRLCDECKAPKELGVEELRRAGLSRFSGSSSAIIYEARGCPACRESGYRGRTGIHELYVLDEKMHRAIIEGADATDLHEIARQSGMVTLHEDGLRKVLAGVTSLDEVLRVTQDQQDA
ncbi:MAG: Flp pilus assembly complex ATPase component TadA [Uliginosibacterium sp.]|nr:Flp pilus assembly complex ATPase component TadA [Uliginosibacterium sp.]